LDEQAEIKKWKGDIYEWRLEKLGFEKELLNFNKTRGHLGTPDFSDMSVHDFGRRSYSEETLERKKKEQKKEEN